MKPSRVAPSDRAIATLAGEERRRSQRVIIRVPIQLEISQAGKDVVVNAVTVAVNIHGAMVVCPRLLEAGTELVIRNDRTREQATARVTRAPRESAEGFLVPLEFTSPSPKFWQITFPPANWKASDT